MTEATGAVRFTVRFGGQPLAGARVWTSVNRFQWSFWGTTNSVGMLIAQTVPAGLNFYMVSLTGFNTASGTVNVIAGSMVAVDVYMTKSLSVVSAGMMGSLTITSNPEGAWIYINGAVQERPTPIIITDLPEGDYTVELSKDGYYSAALVTVNRGQTATATLSLMPT